MVANKQNNEIVVAVKSDPAVIETLKRQNEVIALKNEVFQSGVHYGPPYKGAKNDTLLKPGATFLQQKFQLREQHERLETTIHVDSADPSKSYIIIQNRCRIYNGDGVEVAQADAACTTFEDKYLYRGGSGKVCPDCGGSIMKSKYPDRNTGDLGWYCRDCKANFVSTDERITDQNNAKTLNANPLNLLDTIIAMAQKRASVRATIKATGVDALFSPGDGVTVDYYDGLEQSEQELITVVSKNAPQDAQEGHTDAQPASSTPTSQTSADDAKTAKSRFGNANGGKGSITYPATSYRHGNNLGKVKAAVQEFYMENGKLNTFHLNGSIDKLEAAGTLDPKTHTVEQAVEIIRQHKTAQKSDVSEGAVDLSKVDF